MKVLILAPHPFYIDRGTPIDVDLLVRALTERGDTVDLVVYRDGADRPYPGLTIHRAEMPSWLGEIGPGFSIRKVIADIWLFAAARRLIRRTHYDIIHAGEEAVFAAMWFKFWRGIPYLYDMDSSIAQQMVEKMPWLKPLAGFFNWCEAKAIRGAMAAVPVCNALADLARRRGAAHLVTMHDISQMSVTDFQPGASLRKQLGIRNPILMYVGNLETYQGIDLLLEAFAKSLQQGVQLDLVIAGGSAEHIRHYGRKAEHLGASVHTHFIGPWPAARLGELLGEADILTAPRIRGINTPMKIFPYLHSGKAVLVTDLPTHSQILDDTVAELAPADSEGFAEAIVRLAQDPQRRERLGRAGRAFVEQNHTYAAHKSRVDELYDYVHRQIHCIALGVEQAAMNPSASKIA